MNDNDEMPEAQQLWIALAMCNKRIAEEVAKSIGIMQRLGELMVEG